MNQYTFPEIEPQRAINIRQQTTLKKYFKSRFIPAKNGVKKTRVNYKQTKLEEFMLKKK